jgi:hypothetical protein
MAERAGEAAELDFKGHPHMLRHACGFALANKSRDTRARYPTHGSLYRAVTGSLQGLLEITGKMGGECHNEAVQSIISLIAQGWRDSRL